MQGNSGTHSRLDRDAFLRAIAEVETGTNARAVGRKGERGMYQFGRATWRQHTRSSFLDAHNAKVSYTVAVKHFDWLRDGFVRNGRQPDTFVMAAAWNGGLTRVLSGKMVRATRDYATRVTNLTRIYEPTSRAVAAAAPASVVQPAGLAQVSPPPVAVPKFSFLAEVEAEAPPVLALADDDDSFIAFSLGQQRVAAPSAETRGSPGQLFFFATLGD